MPVCWKCGAAAEEHHRFCVQCGADQSRGAQRADGDGSAAGADPLLGRTVLQKYRIEAPIGAGAMGTIYRAQQVNLGKTIVIKVLHRHLMEDPELVQRFHREARAASRLNHANCVHIIDFGSLADGALFIAMEFIAGIDLADLLERAYPLDHLRVVRIARQICAALDEAHANGVLHRDLKPENIMIEDRRNAPDHVKVVDFGIAKIEDGHSRSTRAFETRVGIVCGTPEYMSPEQARGEKLDARSDLYALGVLMFRAVTDCMPFQGDSAVETVTFHITQPIPDPKVYRPDLPDSLRDLIVTLLAKSRDDRPASAMDVHAELERIERELLASPSVEAQRGQIDMRTAVDLRPISVLIEASELPLPEGSLGASSHLGPAPKARPPQSALMPPPRSDASPPVDHQDRQLTTPGSRSALMPPPRRSVEPASAAVEPSPRPLGPGPQETPTAPLGAPSSEVVAARGGLPPIRRPQPVVRADRDAAAPLRPRRASRAPTDATLRDVGTASRGRPVASDTAVAEAQEAVTQRELRSPVETAARGSRSGWKLAAVLAVGAGLAALAFLLG